MEKKTYRAKMVLKRDDDGEGTGQVEAVFATLNVIDHDEDVTLPGAFGTQSNVIMEPWNHGWTLPVGKGAISEREDEAVFEGEYFLDTQAGREHYTVAKALADGQEWSYTFRILKYSRGEFEDRDVRFLEKMDVIGVSQVDRGAGINTRTTAVKSQTDLIKTMQGLTQALSQGEREKGQREDDGGAGGGDGEADDGKPSGVAPAVVQIQIEILELEE